MLRQPTSWSGRRESMLGLRNREGIMPSQAEVPTDAEAITDLVDGLRAANTTMFAEPYDDDAPG